MTKLPYMPWYPADYSADTSHLELHEHGAYRLLLDHLWLSDGQITFDEKRLAKRLGITPAKFRKIWAEIGVFFCVEGGKISHRRVTAEIEKATEMVEKRIAAAKSAAAKRWKKDKKNKDSTGANAMRDDCQPEPKGSGKTLTGLTMNLPPDGVAAMKKLHASCGDAGGIELEAFGQCITGWDDGTMFVTGRYALDRFGLSLRGPLAAAQITLAVQEPSKPQAQSPEPPLSIVQGGKA